VCVCVCVVCVCGVCVWCVLCVCMCVCICVHACVYARVCAHACVGVHMYECVVYYEMWCECEYRQSVVKAMMRLMCIKADNNFCGLLYLNERINIIDKYNFCCYSHFVTSFFNILFVVYLS
jgi:hypothetical protein